MLGRLRLLLILKEENGSRVRDVDVVWYSNRALVFVYRPEEQSYQSFSYHHGGDIVLTDAMEIARMIAGYVKQSLDGDATRFRIERCHLKNATGIYKPLNYRICIAVRLAMNGGKRNADAARSKA